MSVAILAAMVQRLLLMLSSNEVSPLSEKTTPQSQDLKPRKSRQLPVKASTAWVGSGERKETLPKTAEKTAKVTKNFFIIVFIKSRFILI